MAKTWNLWVPKLKKGAGPVYLSIANAIADDVATGQLTAEQRLPPQRKLAEVLGLDFTTVARAYNEARRRGLVDSVVGRGTFVCGQRRPRIPRAMEGRPNVDMSMNMPPEPESPELLAMMQDGWAHVNGMLRDLMRYQDFGGSQDDRAAGVLWLRRRGLTVELDRLLVVPGAQCGLLAILTSLAGPGSVICCEELTYPGLRALAGQLGIRLVGLPMDAQGIDAVAFAGACAQYAPKALYCNPTLLNPTTCTISLERRQALVEIARHYGVPIIEDDAYGFLPRAAPPAIASIGPDVTFYVAGLAKVVGAGLRVAYMVAPDSQATARLVSSLRATTVMALADYLRASHALDSRWHGGLGIERDQEGIDGTSEARGADTAGGQLYLPVRGVSCVDQFTAIVGSRGFCAADEVVGDRRGCQRCFRGFEPAAAGGAHLHRRYCKQGRGCACARVDREYLAYDARGGSSGGVKEERLRCCLGVA